MRNTEAKDGHIGGAAGWVDLVDPDIGDGKVNAGISREAGVDVRGDIDPGWGIGVGIKRSEDLAGGLAGAIKADIDHLRWSVRRGAADGDCPDQCLPTRARICT